MLLLAAYASAAPVVVFTDDFSTSRGTNFDNSEYIGSSNKWYVEPFGADGGAKIDGGLLQLTNNATGAPNNSGIVRVNVSASHYSTPYKSILNQNPNPVEWTFNMRQPYSDPGQPEAGDFGVAYILAASNASFFSTGSSGYAVVLGSSGDTDPLKLVRYAGTTFTTMVTATAPLADVGAEYLSIRVQFDPVSKKWSMFGRNDGTTAFADPQTGALALLGTATNSTHTGTTLGYSGMLWSYSGTTMGPAIFDNVTVTLVPEPGVLTLLGIAAIAVHRRRRGY